MAYTSINNGKDYFNTVTYTGNGSTQSITGVEFQPDLTWIKQRNGTEWHNLIDSVRGGTKVVYSNAASAEQTSSSLISSFDSDGFSIGNAAEVNGNTNTFVSWNWLAGGTAASNTDGSITSSVSVNTTSGFSIVTYTGTGNAGSFGHGLTSPKIVLIKDRSNSNGWYFHTTAIDGSDDYLYLDQTTAKADAGAGYSIGTSVYNLGGAGSVTNLSGNNYVAYCFAEKKGFSKFGSYTGNNNTDGTFVYTGFKPAWIMIKNTTGDNWVMFDNKREGYNPDNDFLQPNSSNAEATESGAKIDLLSNGFKLRGSGGGIGQTNNANLFFYMAFAENPFVSSTGTPVTAE